MGAHTSVLGGAQDDFVRRSAPPRQPRPHPHPPPHQRRPCRFNWFGMKKGMASGAPKVVAAHPAHAHEGTTHEHPFKQISVQYLDDQATSNHQNASSMQVKPVSSNPTAINLPQPLMDVMSQIIQASHQHHNNGIVQASHQHHNKGIVQASHQHHNQGTIQTSHQNCNHHNNNPHNYGQDLEGSQPINNYIYQGLMRPNNFYDDDSNPHLGLHSNYYNGNSDLHYGSMGASNYYHGDSDLHYGSMPRNNYYHGGNDLHYGSMRPSNSYHGGCDLHGGSDLHYGSMPPSNSYHGGSDTYYGSMRPSNSYHGGSDLHYGCPHSDPSRNGYGQSYYGSGYGSEYGGVHSGHHHY